MRHVMTDVIFENIVTAVGVKTGGTGARRRQDTRREVVDQVVAKRTLGRPGPDAEPAAPEGSWDTHTLDFEPTDGAIRIRAFEPDPTVVDGARGRATEVNGKACDRDVVLVAEVDRRGGRGALGARLENGLADGLRP